MILRMILTRHSFAGKVAATVANWVQKVKLLLYPDSLGLDKIIYHKYGSTQGVRLPLNQRCSLKVRLGVLASSA